MTVAAGTASSSVQDARGWAGPFLEQAREDLRAADAVFPAGCESTFCMLVQMAYEKIAKAAIAHQGNPVEFVHGGNVDRLFGHLDRIPHRPLSGDSPTVRAAIRELETAQPAVAAKAVKQLGPQAQYPQLEYPWRDPLSGTIQWPAKHLPMANRLRDPRQRLAAELLKLARSIESQFDTLFN